MFDITIQDLLSSLPGWGYPVMLFLMIIEGPIVTIVAAFLASLGYFNIFSVYALSILGDVVGDVFFYSLGFYGEKTLLLRAQKFLRISDKTICKIENKFAKNGSQIIFYVKTTTGLCIITFITAGLVKMDIKKFIKFSLLGGLVWSGLTTALGYFFGYAAAQIEQYIKFAGWIIFGAALLIFFYISFKRKKNDSLR